MSEEQPNSENENSILIVMNQIKQFRENPKSCLNQLEYIKQSKNKKEFEKYINSLEPMSELIFDQDLALLAKEEAAKLSEDENYKKYQIGEEFEANISKDFDKNEVALIAIEEIDKMEKLISKIIVNAADEEKKGRDILTSLNYTHIGFHATEEEGTILLIFAKKNKKEEKNESELKNDEDKIEEEEEMELTEEEKILMEQIKEFRENPKALIDKSSFLKKKTKKTEYENYINSLEKMKELKPNKELFELAKEEIKKFSEEDSYKKIQINEEFISNISDYFDKNEMALIAIDNIEKNESLIPFIIINDSDKEKKGRDILTNLNYTHIGFSKSDEDSIILIFAKKSSKKENNEEILNEEKENEIKELIQNEEKKIEEIQNKEIKNDEIQKENILELTEEEKILMNQIKEFRENPKAFINKSDILKQEEKIEEYKNFINSLDKMNELSPNKELFDIAKEEIKTLSEDNNDKYPKIQVGENVEKHLAEKMPDKEIAILSFTDLNNIEEELIPKIIINDLDKEQQGRKILSDLSYTHIGLAILNNQDGYKPVIIIFSKNKEKEKEEDNEAKELNVKIEEQPENNEPENQKKNISNVDMNEPDEKRYPDENIKNEPMDSNANKENEIKDKESSDTNVNNKTNKIDKNDKDNKKGKNKLDGKEEYNKKNINIKKTPSSIEKAPKKKNYVYFFTTFQHYNVKKIDILKKKNENKLEHAEENTYEFNIQTITINTYYQYKILYFKLNLENYNCFYVKIFYTDSKFINSKENKINKDNYILNHISLYEKNKQITQCYLDNDIVLIQNMYLLEMFESDLIYRKNILKKYIPCNKIIISNLLNIMGYYAKYECCPLFLKDIDISNIRNQYPTIYNLNLDSAIFHKLESLIKQEKDNDANKKENLKKCYLFILEIYSWIYYKYNKDKFKELINSEDLLFRASLSRLISNKIIKIKELQNNYNISKENIVPLIIENSSSFDEIKNVFLNFNTILEALEMVNNYYEIIIDKINKKSEGFLYKLNPKNWFGSGKMEIALPEPNEKDDIMSLINIQKILLEKEKRFDSKNEFINFENIIMKLIKINGNHYNLSNLLKLKVMIKNLKDNQKDIKNLDDELNEIFHDIGISLSIRGRLSNSNIIKFIINDFYYNSDNYEETNKRDPQVFKCFNILDKEKEGFADFKELKIYDKFSYKKKDFYKIFIEKLTNFDDLKNLFELFPKDKLDYDFIDLLLKKLNDNNFHINYHYGGDNNDNNKDLVKNMYIIFYNVYQCKYNINKLTSLIERKFMPETIKEIYIKVLSKNDEKLTEYVNEEFSKYFIRNLQGLNIEAIYSLIKSCSSNIKFLQVIFDNIENFAIEEKDFYSPSRSPNFELFELFVKNGYVNEPHYFETKYFSKIAKLNDKLFFDIKELKIPFLKISDLIEKDKEGFKSKLKLIFMNFEGGNPDDSYYKVVNSLEKCKQQIYKLNKVYTFLNLFEPNTSGELLNNLVNMINNLRQKQIKEILKENFGEKINDWNNFEKKAENLKYQDSIFFMKIYEELKKEKGFIYNESQLFKEALSLYDYSIRKIINFKNENFMNIKNIEYILDTAKKEEKNLDKEMQFITNEFNDLINNSHVTIESIKANLVNFANLKELKDCLNGYLFAISLFKDISNKQIFQKTQFMLNLEAITAELANKNIKSESVEKGFKILKDYDIKLGGQNEDDFKEFIIKIHGKTNEIKFCVGKTDEEIKNLNEFLQDRQSESGNLQPDDFNDFIGCKKYVNEVIQSDFSNDSQLNKVLREKLKDDKFIIIKFNNYLEKYGEIKELYDDSIANKSEITKTLIQKLMKNSLITITKFGNNFYFEGKYGEKNEIFDLKLMLQLKNKALFSQNTVTEDKEYREQITKFNDIVLKIYNLSSTVKDLILSGYPPNININLKIEDNTLINVDNKNTTIKEIIDKYEELLDEFDKEITKSYKNKPYLRFLYGPLFLQVLEKIKNNHPIEFLLKSISNGKIKVLPEPEESKIAEEADFSETFSLINNYLDNCFLENKINMERILIKNKLKPEFIKKKGLYRVPVFSDLEKNLVLLYSQLTGNFPLSNTVLFCNEYTSNEEIKAFLYLSFRSDYTVLFCLLGIEKLDSEKRVKTIKSINKFNKKYGKDIRGCLVIMYLKNSEIEKPLNKIISDNREIILNEEKGEMKFESQNIEIYISERAGFGKSEEIKKKIKTEKKHYKYFPLGGDFTREEIIQRLIKFNLPQNDIGNYAIHLDLSETNLTELVEEILFKILVLKKLDINEKIFYFGDELKIKIELPNGFINYLEKFPILKLFKSSTQILKTLTPLRISQDIHKIKESDIQIVANTLNMYKKNQIGSQNLNFESNQLLSDKDCENLINEYINNNETKYNYYQKMTFIKLLSVEFQMFKDTFILDPNNFVNPKQKKAIIQSRPKIINSLISSTLYISKGPYDNLIKSQMTSQETDKIFDEKKANERALISLKIARDKKVSFDNMPEIFFFNGDLTTFTAITREQKGTENYKKLYDLINSLGNERTELLDYSAGDHFFYLEELKKILGLPEMLFDENEIKELNSKILEETKEELDPKIYNKDDVIEDRKLYMAKLAKKNGNYIYTKDNFIKSVIILQKIQASVPVILMGETGCGKTSLLKMLSIFMNKGYEKMKTLNVHAGTNEEDIINFMNKVIQDIPKERKKELDHIMERFESQKEEIKNLYDKDKYKTEQEQKLKEKKVWVFFDELNTCNSMGLITEIMCKRTMHGEPLPNDLVFLGAVNPYRTMTSTMKHSGLTYHTDSNDKNSLVYTVNPLPHTLMNYIFYFGNLESDEEREYIKSMIMQNFTKYYPDKENAEYKKLIDKTLESICDCHNFMRKNYDESSVSLREIRRFNIFFKFFLDYLKNKSIYKSFFEKTYNLLLGTLNITLYLCYYLRISDKKIRDNLAIILDKYFDGKLFIEMPLREVTYIAEQFVIDYEKGIALNRSLKENLFTSFICIVNRIPLIIVGKPGEGKSLTIQTINQTMKGTYSKSPLFKEYPQLFMYNYQGSETSTSQGIIETFDKARNYAKNQLKKIKAEPGEKKEKFIAMIFFDEMGLAERSPNNPLKAIHSQLEYDDNEFKIAFVGISNWKIDASKMNRCLTLSKPDPDKEDLILTADTIAKALDNTLANNYKNFIEALALSYYEYKKMTNKNKLIENFHGNRDFYNLIKCAMRKLIKERDNINEINSDKILTKIGLMSLTRNFGGLDTSLKDIKSKFAKIFTNYNEDESYNYNILECIKDNLNDYNSRFLMLVANSTIIKYLENVLDSQGKDYIFLTGSQFQQDKKAAEKGGGYSEDLLNKIQYQMSKDSVLILKNLEVIYPSLYELFNQNYIKIGDKYFSKIAFASSKSSSEVHKNFRVILLITQQQLDKMKVDPPLLNRFEKQIVSFKDSLNENQINLANNLVSCFESIRTFGNKKNLVYNLPDLMFNCNRDEIEGLIYKISNAYKDNNNNNEFIENKIFEILVPSFCQDIIASVKYSGFSEGINAERAKKILNIYKKREINNFSGFLEKMKKDKNVIYTFSNKYDIEENNLFKKIIVESINSENKVQDEMSKFYGGNMRYLIFQFEEKDLNKMNHLSYLVNNFEIKYRQQNATETNDTSNDEENINIINTSSNVKKKSKIIIFIVHLTRKYTGQKKGNEKNKNKEKIKTTFFTEELISTLDDSYDKYFIDNLRSERNDFSNILDIQNPAELVTSIINFEQFLDKNLNTIISYFDYNFLNKFDSDMNLKFYTDTILTNLILKKDKRSVKYLRQLLKDITLKKMNQNIIPKVYTSKVFQNTDVDFFQVLETYITSELATILLSVINVFEKGGIFSCFLIKENKNVIENKLIKDQIKTHLENLDFSLMKKPAAELRMNKIDLFTDLSIPSIYSWLKQIKVDFIIKEKIGIKYVNNENSLRPRKELSDEIKTKEEYWDKYKNYVDAMQEQFYKNQNIREIFQSDSQEMKSIKKAFYLDTLLIYCIEINEKFSNKNDKYIKPIQFIEILLQLKFNIMFNDVYKDDKIEIELSDSYFDTIEDFNIRHLSEVFLFLQSYKSEIIILSEVFCLLNSYLPNTFDKMKEIIKSRIIKTEVSKRNQSYKKIVNEIFYILMESLLKTIYNNNEEIYNLEIYAFYSFFDSLPLIEAIFNKINQKFLLYSNELYSLRNISAVYNIFKDEQDIKDIIKQALVIIGKDNEYLKNNEFNNLKENIMKIKKIISDRYGSDSDKLAGYMSNLLRQQYRKIDDNDYKFELLNLAFENDKLIQKSLFFISNTINIPYPVLYNKTKKEKNIPKNYFEKPEECAQYFLGFINHRKNDRIYQFYENIQNESFNQVLSYYFETLAYNYFSEIINKYKSKRPDPSNPNIKSNKECDELLLKQNLLFLNKSLIHMDKCFNKEDLDENALNNLGNIYSIAYVKLYLTYLAEIYKYNKTKISFNQIINLISSTEYNTRKVIKLFFFKCFYQYFENFAQFNDYIKNDNEFPFREDYLNMLQNQNTNIYILNNNFLPMKYFEIYSTKEIEFLDLCNNNFKNLNKFINEEFIRNNGLDIFFCLCVNILFSYCYSNEKDKYIQKINFLKSEFNKISNNLGLSICGINILTNLLDFNTFIQKIISKQKEYTNLSQHQFEIFMYALRFVLSSSQFSKNNFYYNLLNPQCKDYINNNYIIGTLPFNNIFLKSYYSLNVLLRSPSPIPTGYYVCTCGQYYTLGNCTCPREVFDCYNPNCKLKIAGTSHVLLGPSAGQTDHWRIRLEENDNSVTPYAQGEINKGKIPCITLAEFKRRYVDKYITQQPKGIKKEEAEDFFERKNIVRTLDELSFRILNFILYSHLFFSNILNNFDDQEMNAYTHGEITCFRMIEKNWELMEVILNEKGIDNIKGFMNIIFGKLEELMGSIEDMSTIEKRQQFETDVQNYISNLVKEQNEYQKMASTYNNYNDKIKGNVDPNSLIEILSENYSPFENIYSKENYPNMEMFLISKYPNMNELNQCLEIQPNYEKNYCLLNQVFIQSEEYSLIENVQNINKLFDYLYKKYNNKIERNKAKNMKITECFENEDIEEMKENYLQPFIDSWNKIKHKCKKYLCRPDMPELNITSEHSLIYFLPDDGELYYGMYLASAYRNFIEWQNTFIQLVISSIGPHSLLKSYLSQLSQMIYVQDATEEDLVKINNGTYNKVKDMITQYSMRNIFKNGKIDFKEFKKAIKYDFDSIEIELGRIILPGLKQFFSSDNDTPIRFVSYLYEAFRSSRSSIITNYNEKYPPRELTEQEQKLLYSFIDENKNKNQNFSKDVLVSCQILIDFIQKENFNKNTQLFSIIKKLPKYIEIDDSLKNFFIKHSEEDINNNNDEFKMYSINTLINIYNLIEWICWSQFKENLNDQYKMNLPQKIKESIKDYLDKTITENSLIKKQDIADAVRRLISRYLSGKRGDVDISEYQKLSKLIIRADLWRSDLVVNDNFEEDVTNIFEGINKLTNIVIECNDVDNKCDDCLNSKIKEPCKECDYCKWGLRIGHGLEFHELINEEIFNANKFNEKERGYKSEDEDDELMRSTRFNERKKKTKNIEEKKSEEVFEINTNAQNLKDDEDNEEEEIDKENEIEHEVVEVNEEEQEQEPDEDDRYDLDEDDEKSI